MESPIGLQCEPGEIYWYYALGLPELITENFTHAHTYIGKVIIESALHINMPNHTISTSDEGIALHLQRLVYLSRLFGARSLHFVKRS